MPLDYHRNADNTETDLSGEIGHLVDDADKILAAEIGEILHNHYPGHLWGIFVNSEPTGGIVNILNLRISHKYGYVLHLAKLYPRDDTFKKKIIHAGGEILERANMTRGRATGDNAGWVEGVKKKVKNIIV